MMSLSCAPVTDLDVRTHTRRDPVMSKVLDFIQNGWPHKYEPTPEFQPFYRRSTELSCESGCILWGSRVVIPPTLRNQVLNELHQVHPDMTRMKALARSYVWWPSMDRTIEERVNACSDCQHNQRMPASTPLHPWEATDKPWTRLHIDYAGPFLGKMFLILVDSYSKWIEAFPTTNSTSTTTI